MVAGIALTCGVTTNVPGASVTLTWDRNPESNVAGYKIYYGRSSQTYPFVVDAGNATTRAIGNLQEGASYYFAVTAYNIDGLESAFSGEIPYTVPRRPISALGDGSFRLRFRGTPGVTYRIQCTESLTTPDWQTLDALTADANGELEMIDLPGANSAKRFYRTVYP